MGQPWKSETECTFRLCFMWFPGLEELKPDLGTVEKPTNPSFLGAPIFRIRGVGDVVSTGPEITALAGGGPPLQKVVTVVAVWPLREDGVPDGTRIDVGEVDVGPWVFSGGTYTTLVLVNREFPFALHDLKVQIDDAEFQRVTFTPCKESLLRKFLEGSEKERALIDPVIARAAACLSGIEGHLGRMMTPDQLRAAMVETTDGSDGGGLPIPRPPSRMVSHAWDLIETACGLTGGLHNPSCMTDTNPSFGATPSSRST